MSENFGKIGPQALYGDYRRDDSPNVVRLLTDGLERREGNERTLKIIITSTLKPPIDLVSVPIEDEPVQNVEIHFPEMDNIGTSMDEPLGVKISTAIQIGYASLYGLFNGASHVEIVSNDSNFNPDEFIKCFQVAVNNLPGAEDLTIENIYEKPDEMYATPDVSRNEDEMGRTCLEYVLLSGGPDSATVARMAKMGEVMSNHNRTQPANEVRAIYVDFGQPYAVRELQAAKNCAEDVGIPLEVIDIRSISETFQGKGELGYPIFRELLPLTLLLVSIYARLRGATTLFHGQIKEDEDDIPGTNAFMESLIHAVNVLFGDEQFSIKLNLKAHPKQAVFEIAQELGVNIRDTVSCLKGNGVKPCGTCRACIRRSDALRESGYSGQ